MGFWKRLLSVRSKSETSLASSREKKVDRQVESRAVKQKPHQVHLKFLDMVENDTCPKCGANKEKYKEMRLCGKMVHKCIGCGFKDYYLDPQDLSERNKDVDHNLKANSPLYQFDPAAYFQQKEFCGNFRMNLEDYRVLVDVLKGIPCLNFNDPRLPDSIDKNTKTFSKMLEKVELMLGQSAMQGGKIKVGNHLGLFAYATDGTFSYEIAKIDDDAYLIWRFIQDSNEERSEQPGRYAEKVETDKPKAKGDKSPPNNDRADCPFHSHGDCGAGGGGHSCSFVDQAPYATACNVYKAFGGPAGLRTCSSCGVQWRSMYGSLMDLCMFGPTVDVGVSCDPSNLKGLTCTKCSKSFCKKCLRGNIPTKLPGGNCPLCGGALNVA